MLVLSRKIGEEIVIGKTVRIMVTGIDDGKVRLGVTAPRDVPVYRREIQDVIDAAGLPPDEVRP